MSDKVQITMICFNCGQVFCEYAEKVLANNMASVDETFGIIKGRLKMHVIKSHPEVFNQTEKSNG